MNKISLSTLIAFAIVASFPTSCSALEWKDVLKRSPAALLTTVAAVSVSELCQQIKNNKNAISELRNPQSQIKTSGKYLQSAAELFRQFPTITDQEIHDNILKRSLFDLKVSKISLLACIGLTGLFTYLTYNPTSYKLIRKLPGVAATSLVGCITLGDQSSSFSQVLTLVLGYATYIA